MNLRHEPCHFAQANHPKRQPTWGAREVASARSLRYSTSMRRDASCRSLPLAAFLIMATIAGCADDHPLCGSRCAETLTIQFGSVRPTTGSILIDGKDTLYVLYCEVTLPSTFREVPCDGMFPGESSVKLQLKNEGDDGFSELDRLIVSGVAPEFLTIRIRDDDGVVLQQELTPEYHLDGPCALNCRHAEVKVPDGTPPD